MHLLPLFKSNQYHLRYCNLLPQIVRHKHDWNVKHGGNLLHSRFSVVVIWLWKGRKTTIQPNFRGLRIVSSDLNDMYILNMVIHESAISTWTWVFISFLHMYSCFLVYYFKEDGPNSLLQYWFSWKFYME